MTNYFPVALNLEGRRCLVVGGGAIAERKVNALLDAGARVVVVAPQISAEIEAFELLQAVELRRRPYQSDDLAGCFIVVAATDNRETNALVAAQARENGALVNAVDDPASCDFITPAVVRRGDIQIAVTTSGTSPALARHLREQLEQLLPPEYANLATLLGEVRMDLRRNGRVVAPDAWQEAIGAALPRLLAGDTAGAGVELRARLAQTPKPVAGRIVLVGAGPGNRGLLTLAGREAIAEADVLVYDRLVNPEMLEFARADARLVYVGKRRGGGTMTQAQINDLLCTEARAGKLVVRLKGGDPFVFGRGGEEALAAQESGVRCTVIPGVTAAIAAPAAAGIPVTHRGLASSFTVVTGHQDPTSDGALDWNELARGTGTLVLLMGVETLDEVCLRLVAGGRAATTPAAVVQAGTTDEQRVVTGTLATIAERARAAEIEAPATTVIGEVAALAEVLAWQEESNPATIGG